MPRYMTIAPGILLDVTWRCGDCGESEYNVNQSDSDPYICEGCADPFEDE